MPKGWEKFDGTMWRCGDAEVDVQRGLSGWFAAAGCNSRPERVDAVADAIVLARAMTPGWVVVEQSVVWSLEDEVARLRSANGYLAQSACRLQEEVSALTKELCTPWYTRLLRRLWP